MNGIGDVPKRHLTFPSIVNSIVKCCLKYVPCVNFILLIHCARWFTSSKAFRKKNCKTTDKKIFLSRTTAVKWSNYPFPCSKYS